MLGSFPLGGAALGDDYVGALLTGGVAGSGASSGSLTTSVLLTGSVSGVAAISGSITTGLVGRVAGVATLTGTFTTGISFSGSVLGVGDVSGTLTTAIRLSGAVAGLGAVIGAISSKSPLVGTEILHVVPIRWDGGPGPVPLQTNTAAIAALISSGGFTVAFLNWFKTLPTTRPPISGQPWNDGNTLAVS